MKPQDIKAHNAEICLDEGYEWQDACFTAKETAKMLKAYGHAIRVQHAASERIDESPVRNERKYGYLFSKAKKFILDYEKLTIEWDK